MCVRPSVCVCVCVNNKNIVTIIIIFPLSPRLLYIE